MALRTPPLGAVHESRGAKVTEFGGWEMPVEFDSIRTEHESVRETAGKFDVSHMGEIVVSGPDAEELMNRLTSNDASTVDAGAAQYAAITDADGVMLDDTMLYRLPESREGEFLFVPNAGNDAAMEERWNSHRDEWGLDATVENRTEEYAMIAVQGPDSAGLVAEATDDDSLADLSSFAATDATIAGSEGLLSRTGYTGEDGFEVIFPWEDAGAVWEAFDCQPCGLGARDTLRMEAGLLLAGQDFDSEANPRDPYEAGIGFAVDTDTEFVGRDALADVSESGPAERLAGFELDERAVARHGYEIQNGDGQSIGTVTSGTMAPTLGVPIGLGYVPAEYAEPETEVEIVVRSEAKDAHITALPFYER